MKPVKNKEVLPITLDDYIYLEEHSGFRVNDLVKVIRKARSSEHGWHNTWVPEMDDYVGGIFPIYDIPSYKDGRGIGVGNFHFPYFVLERVPAGTMEDIVPQFNEEEEEED